jgi:hypothetical protein
VLALRSVLQRPVRRRSIFFFELRARARTLLGDVYALARGLHWAERDILSLTVQRRLAYLLLLEEESDAALLAELEAPTP